MILAHKTSEIIIIIKHEGTLYCTWCLKLYTAAFAPHEKHSGSTKKIPCPQITTRFSSKVVSFKITNNIPHCKYRDHNACPLVSLFIMGKSRSKEKRGIGTTAMWERCVHLAPNYQYFGPETLHSRLSRQNMIFQAVGTRCTLMVTLRQNETR